MKTTRLIGTMCKWSDPFSKSVLIDRGLDHNSLETLKSQRKNVSSDYSVLKARPSKKHWTNSRPVWDTEPVIWSVTMTVRFHLFPFRTQKLSSLVPKIVRWKRRVKIGSRRLLYGPLVKRLRQRPLTPLTSVRFRYGSSYAPLAQLVEQLTLNQWAQGSSPWRCTNKRALNRKI